MELLLKWLQGGTGSSILTLVVAFMGMLIASGKSPAWLTNIWEKIKGIFSSSTSNKSSAATGDLNHVDAFKLLFEKLDGRDEEQAELGRLFVLSLSPAKEDARAE